MKVGINATFLAQSATGTGVYLTELLRALPDVAPALEVCLYAPDGRDLPERLPYRLKSLALPAIGDGPRKLLFEQVAFPRAALGDQCDVLHVPYFAPPFIGGERCVATVHDLIPLVMRRYASGMAARAYAQLVRASARRTALLLTDSKCAKRDAVQRLGLTPDRIEVAYLAVGEHLRPVVDPGTLARLRDRYALPARYILYAGGFDHRKSVPVLLDAYARLTRTNAPPPLVIAGRLPTSSTVAVVDPRRLVSSLGLEGRVQFMGAFAEGEKAALLSGASVFVYPSVYEGFGLPPLEAMACGVPVVATRAGSLPEVCGDAAELARPGDAESLAGGIARVLGSAAVSDELRRRGLERAKRFSWRETVRVTAAAYGRVAG